MIFFLNHSNWVRSYHKHEKSFVAMHKTKFGSKKKAKKNCTEGVNQSNDVISFQVQEER